MLGNDCTGSVVLFYKVERPEEVMSRTGKLFLITRITKQNMLNLGRAVVGAVRKRLTKYMMNCTC